MLCRIWGGKQRSVSPCRCCVSSSVLPLLPGAVVPCHTAVSCLMKVCLQDRLASGDKIFEPLLEKYLLKNTHKISARVLPDKQLAAQQEEAERLKLAERMQHMSEADKDAAVKETADLKLRQVGALDHTQPLAHVAMLACCCT